jgi:SOS response regulatory protein OraA/RecX
VGPAGDPDPLELAARALRRRDRSARDVDERLARAGVGEDQRVETLAALERLGYVDDDRYAAGRAASLAARGWGDEGIRELLARDGVAAASVDAALAALEPERERAAAIVRRNGASARTARRLAAKGFGDELVEVVAAGGLADV